MALSNKQKLFVKHYLVSKNATAAAKAAGYSEKTAGKIGSENLSKPEIKKALDAQLNASCEKLEITAERILNRIAEIAFDKKYIKESDTLKACELLGRNKKLFVDKTELSGEVTTSPVIINLIANGTEKK